MDESVRWTVKVSKETDVALRTYLAQSGMRKGDLSKFIEDAVRWRVLDRTVAQARERVATIRPTALQALIDEAVAKVRTERSARRLPESGSIERQPAKVSRRVRR